MFNGHGEKKSELVAVRFSKSERDWLDREAKSLGVSLTKLIHDTMHEAYFEELSFLEAVYCYSDKDGKIDWEAYCKYKLSQRYNKTPSAYNTKPFDA